MSLGAAYLFRSPKPEPVVRSSILPPAGTSFVTLLPASGPPVNSHRWPSFLPDGKHFLFWGRSSRTQENTLYVGELGSLQAKTLAKTDSMAIYAAGYLLFMRDQNLIAQPFDPRRIELSGEPVPVAEHIAINGATARPLFSASQNGMLIYQTGENSGGWNLLWWGRDGKLTGSAAQPDRYLFPTLSPDDTRFASMIFTGALGNEDVWVFDLARGTSTRLTFTGNARGFPVLVGGRKNSFLCFQSQGHEPCVLQGRRWQWPGTRHLGN